MKTCNPVIVVHGGAIFDMSDDSEYKKSLNTYYHTFLQKALEVGYTSMAKGTSALDAAVESARILEDCGYFEAGKGSVTDSSGNISIDAAVMDGKTLEAGSVADCMVKNGSAVARLVLQKTPHVMLVGEGAEKLAQENGLEPVFPSYFSHGDKNKKSEHGTIGVVTRDTQGNLAAVTSTGGLPGKLPHRVGDSPIIGAGVYANNQTCAVSCTGSGEYFMRTVAAFHVSARMKYGKQTLVEASQGALDDITHLKGRGGMICVDSEGTITMPYNCAGMFRGYIDQSEKQVTEIF